MNQLMTAAEAMGHLVHFVRDMQEKGLITNKRREMLMGNIRTLANSPAIDSLINQTVPVEI